MNRSEIREQIFKLLFRVEFNRPEEMAEQTELFFAAEDNVKALADAAYIKAKLFKILNCLPELDRMLSEKAAGWELDRMGKVDLAILRLAVYEIDFDSEIPARVAINEAVELAKRFGQDNSKAFVNGVLSKFAQSET